MWIILNDAMLSVVAFKGEPDHLLVRARLRGDIEAVFPGATVRADGGSDYKFRAMIPREVVINGMIARVEAISYGNFKDSVKDPRRKVAYMDIWNAGFRMQQAENPLRWDQPVYGGNRRARKGKGRRNRQPSLFDECATHIDDFADRWSPADPNHAACTSCDGSGMIQPQTGPIRFCEDCDGRGIVIVGVAAE